MAHIKALRNRWLAAFAEQQGEAPPVGLGPARPPADGHQAAVGAQDKQEVGDQRPSAPQQTAQNQQQQRQANGGALLPKKRLLEAAAARGGTQPARCAVTRRGAWSTPPPLPPPPLPLQRQAHFVSSMCCHIGRLPHSTIWPAHCHLMGPLAVPQRIAGQEAAAGRTRNGSS
jgi:hypothetical protein